MPHFTTLFGRPQTHDFPLDLKKSTPRSSSSKKSRPVLSDRSPSSSGSSLVSQDGSVQMPEPQPPILKRLSKGILHQTPKPRSSSFVIQPASVDLDIESPPLVLYGSENSSDGALASGTLKITVHEDAWSVKSFKMVLNKEMTRKKPFHQGCPECSNEMTELKEWNFLSATVTTLPRGKVTTNIYHNSQNLIKIHRCAYISFQLPLPRHLFSNDARQSLQSRILVTHPRHIHER